MWKQREVNLGEVQAKVKKDVVFEYEGDINVKEIIPGCGCTECKWNPETKELRVQYMPGSVPFHLKQAGKHSYHSIKRVIVNSEKSSDILTFTAQVTD